MSDEVTLYYAANKIPVTCASYRNAQALIAGYLALAGKVSVVKFAIFISKLESNPTLRDWIARRIDNELWADDDDLNDFIKQSRRELARIITYCMVFSSPFMLVIIAGVFLALLAVQIMDCLKHKTMRSIALLLEGVAKVLEAYSATQYGKHYEESR